MKVKDLRAALAGLDDELEVFCYAEEGDSSSTFVIDEVKRERARVVPLSGGGIGLKFEAAGSQVVVISLMSDA